MDLSDQDLRKKESMAMPFLKSIHDIHQQIWILQEKNLIATPHNRDLSPVILNILPCRNEDSLEKNKGKPIFIGIKDHNLCLSCLEGEGHVTLKLEVKDIMDLYQSERTEKPFIFYYQKTGSTATFESAAYPGWFISTSSKRGEPVKMTTDLGSKNNIDFYLSNIQ